MIQQASKIIVFFLFFIDFFLFLGMSEVYAQSANDLKVKAQTEEQNGNITLAVQQYSMAGQSFWNAGQPLEAIPMYKKAQSLNEQTGNIQGAGKINSILGLLYSEAQDYTNAINYTQKSVSFAQSQGNKADQAHALANLGGLYTQTGEYKKSTDAYLKVESLAKELKDNSMLMSTYLALSECYTKQSNNDKGLEYYDLYNALQKLEQKKQMEDVIDQSQSVVAEANAKTEMVENELEGVNDSLSKANAIIKLNETQIKLLETETKLKEAALRETEIKLSYERQTLKALVGVIFLILFFSAWMWRMYKGKARINTDLNQKKNELDHQNKELEKLSVVASKTDNCVTIFDSDARLEWVNNAVTKIHQISPDEYLMRKGDHIFDITMEANSIEGITDCIENKHTVSYEYPLTRQDGEKIWIHTTLTPIVNESGEVSKYIAIDSDITEIKKAEQQIVLQNKQIKMQNSNIRDSIEYAQKIQRAILPSSELLNQYIDSFVIFKPRDIVSGDFYWTSHVKASATQGDLLFIAAVDCTGHGVPGAFMSLIANRLLSEILQSKKINEPGRMLDYMNDGINRALQQEETENNDGLDMVLCRMEKAGEQTKVIFAGAKRPLFVYRQKTKTLETISGTRQSIGGVRTRRRNIQKPPFESVEILLEKDDVMYLSSDGFVDQNDPKRTKFGIQRLQNVLEDAGSLTLEKQKMKLEEALSAHQQDSEQRDDILLMGVKGVLKKFTGKTKLNYEWGSKTILIAEDDDINYMVLSNMLQHTHVKIEWAKNGEEAIEFVSKNPGIDLILMDIMMPVINGLDAIRIIKKEYPVPIVVQTASEFVEQKRLAFDAGCDDYITKPIQQRELFATLSKYLGRD